MKTLLILILLATTSCASTVPIVKDCGSEAVANLIDDVNTALSTGDYVGELAKLVGKFGACVIEKAVRVVADQAETRAQFDELEAAKVKRARDWLASRS